MGETREKGKLKIQILNHWCESFKCEFKHNLSHIYVCGVSWIRQKKRVFVITLTHLGRWCGRFGIAIDRSGRNGVLIISEGADHCRYLGPLMYLILMSTEAIVNNVCCGIMISITFQDDYNWLWIERYPLPSRDTNWCWPSAFHHWQRKADHLQARLWEEKARKARKSCEKFS